MFQKAAATTTTLGQLIPAVKKEKIKTKIFEVQKKRAPATNSVFTFSRK